MRWPIQIQLLVPMLVVVLLGVALATGAGAWLSYEHARRQQEENLGRVVETLLDATFPLTDRVLAQMSGLSGAEFLVLDPEGRPRAATLAVDGRELGVLNRLPLAQGLKNFSSTTAGVLGGHSYLGSRIRVPGRFAAIPPGSLVVLYREDRWSSAAWRAVWPALAVGGLASLAAVAVTAVLARRFVRPVNQLCARTVAIAEGRLQPMAVPRRDDEIRDLVLSINRMADQLRRYEAEVRQNERLRALGQLGAGIAHQLRNAATGARMAIELHQRQCGSEDEGLDVALAQLQLMESYVQRILSLGQPGPTQRETVDLAALACEAAELVRPACRHGRIELDVQAAEPPPAVLAQRDALRDLLVNLLLNAIDAARRGAGPPRVRLRVETDPGRRAVVQVEDSGAGPGEEVRERLFEPFVSDKPEGTGVGLFVARRVVETHGGSIRWERRADMTCFLVELPLHAAAEVHGAPARSG